MSKKSNAKTTGLDSEETESKTYEELYDHEQIVVRIGPKLAIKNNKPVEIDKERLIMMTKAGFESLDKDENGEHKLTPAKAMGLPVITIEDNPRVPGGKKKSLSYTPFAVIVDDILQDEEV